MPRFAQGTAVMEVEGNTVYGIYIDGESTIHGFTAVVPEPSGLALIAVGAICLVRRGRRES